MSVHVMNLVWQRAPYGENTLLTLLALADWANDDGVSWPSLPTLAEKTRQSDRHVKRIIKKLEEDGVITIERRVNNSSLYRINSDRFPSKARGDKMSPQGVTSATGGVTFDVKKVSQMSPNTPNTPLEAHTRIPSSSRKKGKKEPDPRFESFKAAIQKAHEFKTKGQVYWDAAPARNLRQLLDRFPKLTLEEFQWWLRNYWASKNINIGFLPHQYIPKLNNYSAGALDQYGKLLGGDHGRQNRGSERESANARAIIEGTGTHRRQSAPGNGVSHVEGHDREGSPAVARLSLPLPRGSDSVGVPSAPNEPDILP